MEGVPRIGMLTVDVKCSMSSVDFGERLRPYIAEHYGDDPAKYTKAIDQLNEMRDQTARASVDAASFDVVRRYYRQLLKLSQRVPMETGDPAAAVYTWLDRASDLPAVYDNVNYELACQLHNLGCMHSQAGVLEPRDTLESIKTALTHYQTAAWTFKHLRDELCAKGYSEDFDDQVMTFLTNLMLAQAQECVVEKSLIDNRKRSLVAKIAQKVVEMYAQLTTDLHESSLAHILVVTAVANYSTVCPMKVHYYEALAAACMAEDAMTNAEYGARVTWWRRSVGSLNDCIKTANRNRGILPHLNDTLDFAKDFIKSSYEIATKDNSFIYHAKCPEAIDLPPLMGVLLVKPTKMEVGKEVDLFADLVPMEVHKMNSMYSEKKAEVLREINGLVAAKDEELQEFLLAADMASLDASSDEPSPPFTLPHELVDASAAFNAQPDAVPRLLDNLQRLTNFYQEAERLLGEIGDAYRMVKQCVGGSATMAALEGECREMGKSIASHQANHSAATDMNTQMQRTVASESSNLQLLGLPLTALTRRLADTEEDKDNQDGEEEWRQLRRMLAKVDEMKTQRSSLVGQLRDALHEHDLTTQLIADKEHDPQALFDSALAEHDMLKKTLQQNLDAQSNILTALANANAAYADERVKMAKVKESREKRVAAVLASHAVFVDLLERSKAGLRFYENHLKQLRKLDMQLDKFTEDVEEAKNKSPLGDISPAAMGAISPMSIHDTPVVSTASAKGNRPRLADYMAYYRAKQTGGGGLPPTTTAFPPPIEHGTQILPVAVAPANMIPPPQRQPPGMVPQEQQPAARVPPASPVQQIQQMAEQAPRLQQLQQPCQPVVPMNNPGQPQTMAMPPASINTYYQPAQQFQTPQPQQHIPMQQPQQYQQLQQPPPQPQQFVQQPQQPIQQPQQFVQQQPKPQQFVQSPQQPQPQQYQQPQQPVMQQPIQPHQPPQQYQPTQQPQQCQSVAVSHTPPVSAAQPLARGGLPMSSVVAPSTLPPPLQPTTLTWPTSGEASPWHTAPGGQPQQQQPQQQLQQPPPPQCAMPMNVNLLDGPLDCNLPAPLIPSAK